jgi:hypothetical protein
MFSSLCVHLRHCGVEMEVLFDFRIEARYANALRSRGVWVCVAAGQRRSSHVGSVVPGGRQGLTLRE